ncbi:hypothetical protein Poli38472_011849 [Pythium oligandrum]|uniref:Uncharacterized protein n=1 Tax=Pythium oligandrum TaxID=41045 RepID=A0A8K1FDE8_PYTOL|nr:hypothetical protein Poli38472_011849 [Pythium oligandrum]|eukprot:TMW58261.1 hypothetical protein Poli38472_011849 [Pythium oligandrum]
METWGDVDGDAVLAAALALIDGDAEGLANPQVALEPPMTSGDDEWGAFDTTLLDLDRFPDENTSMESNSAGSASSEASVSSPEKKPPRKRRNARQEELQMLRQTEKELRHKLLELQRANGGSLNKMIVRTKPARKAWEHAAAEERAKRERAERENAKLRALLEDQVRMIKGFDRLVLKRRSTTELLSWHPAQRLRFPDEVNSVRDPSSEMELKQTVMDMYSNLDHITKDSRFAGSQPKLVTEFLTGSDGKPAFHVFEAGFLPFDFRASADAAWDVWVQPPPKMHGSYTQLETNQTLDSVCTYSEGTGHIPGTYRSRLVRRRFIEDNRVVILGTILLEPQEMDGVPMYGTFLQTQIWMILQPTEGGTSRQQFCTMTPGIRDPTSTTKAQQEERMQALLSFMQDHMESKVDANYRTLVSRLEDLRVGVAV